MKLDEEKIRRQAKAIMDEFIKALDRAGKLEGKAWIERDENTRQGKKTKADNSFRERMLKNAPRKDGNYVLTERKSW